MATVDSIDTSLQAENEMVRIHNVNNEREIYEGTQEPDKKADDEVRQLIAGDHVTNHHHPPAERPPLPRRDPPAPESNLTRNLLLAAALGGMGLGGTGLGTWMARDRPADPPPAEDKDAIYRPYVIPIQPGQ